MQQIWDFIQNQILGMKWLNELIGTLLTAFGLDVSGRIGSSIQFFIYDTIKIFVLLGFLIFVISYIQSYFPPERTKRYSEDFTALVRTSSVHYSVRSRRSALARPFRCSLDLQVLGFRLALPSRF